MQQATPNLHHFLPISCETTSPTLGTLPVELQRHIVAHMDSVLSLLTVTKTFNFLASEQLYSQVKLSNPQNANAFVDLILRSAHSPSTTVHAYGRLVKSLVIIIGTLEEDRSQGPGALHELLRRSQPSFAQALPLLQRLRIVQFLQWPTTIQGMVFAPFMANCPFLSLLSMINTQMNPSSWDVLAQSCFHLRELNIKEICVVLDEHVTSSALSLFAENCGPTLEILRLRPIDVLGEDGLKKFIDMCPNLRWVELCGSSSHKELYLVSCHALKSIAKTCLMLEMLVVRPCEELDEECLALLGGLKWLKQIEIGFRNSVEMEKGYRQRYYEILTRRNKNLKVSLGGVQVTTQSVEKS